MKSTIKIIINEILDELQYYRTLQYFRLAQKDVSQIHRKVWKFFQNPRNSTYDEMFINHINNKLFDDASGDIWQNVRLLVKMQVMEDIRDKVEQSQRSISNLAGTHIYLTLEKTNDQ